MITKLYITLMIFISIYLSSCGENPSEDKGDKIEVSERIEKGKLENNQTITQKDYDRAITNEVCRFSSIKIPRDDARLLELYSGPAKRSQKLISDLAGLLGAKYPK